MMILGIEMKHSSSIILYCSNRSTPSPANHDNVKMVPGTRQIRYAEAFKLVPGVIKIDDLTCCCEVCVSLVNVPFTSTEVNNGKDRPNTVDLSTGKAINELLPDQNENRDSR